MSRDPEAVRRQVRDARARVDVSDWQTFGIASPKDMLDKLRWEIERCRPIVNRDEAKFAGMNIAWTAWHALEWIAFEISMRGRWEHAAAELTLDIGSTTTDAQRERRLMQYGIENSASMEAAEQIANASKHRARWSDLFNQRVHTPASGSPEVRIIVTDDHFIHGMGLIYFGEQTIEFLERLMHDVGIPC